MVLRTPSSPHIHAPLSVSRMMLTVVAALIPGIIAYVWFFGWGIIIQILIALVVALGSEALMLHWRRRPVVPFILDGSAIVTALLLALSLPSLAPWWITVLGTAFAIVVAKHLYGGLGYNPFNPAMVGYVMLLISFPREMTLWPAPQMFAQVDLSLGQTLATIFTGHPPAGIGLDAVTMATPLDQVKTELGMNFTIGEIFGRAETFGDFSGHATEWVGNWFLLGGLWLIYKRVITWHIPVAMLTGLLGTATLFWLFYPDHYPSPMYHLFSGAAILGAFFIATDPISAATTPKGRLIYGAGIGVLTYVIRSWGGYPEGVAFAVLLMNMAAPTIDHYTRPRVFGHERPQ
mgnify:CR=1 FL=1